MVVGEEEKMSEFFEGGVEDKQEGALAPDSMLEQGERHTNGRREGRNSGPGKQKGAALLERVEAVVMAQSGIARRRTSQVSGEHHESETQSVSCP